MDRVARARLSACQPVETRVEAKWAEEIESSHDLRAPSCCARAQQVSCLYGNPVLSVMAIFSGLSGKMNRREATARQKVILKSVRVSLTHRL